MRHVTLESLESRRLLAAQIVNGELIATGTDLRDDIELRRVGTDDVRMTIRTNFSSTPSSQQTFDLDNFNRIRALGLAGNDYLHVVGNVTLPNLTLDGGADEGDVLLARNARFVDGESIRNGVGTLVADFTFGPISYDLLGTSGPDRISWTRRNGEQHLELNSSFAGSIVRTDFGYSTIIQAGAGNDTIIIGDGMSLLADGGIFGEDGNDFFDIAAGARVDVDAGNGDDTLFARGGPENNDLTQILGVGAGFGGGPGVDSIKMDRQTQLRMDTVTLFEMENVIDAQGTIYGNGLANRITVRSSNTAGTTVFADGGNDTVIGGPGPDKLWGEEGDDTLIGNGGNDFLDGGPGLDSLSGGDGDDTLNNGTVDDDPQFFIKFDLLTVNATFANETIGIVRVGVDDVRININSLSRTFDMDDFTFLEISGGAGQDVMTLGAGIDDVTMLGGPGNDQLTGNELPNVLSGDAGNVLVAGAGDDTLIGNGGNDVLGGGPGNDTLDAGTGNDSLIGGEGDDTITGGPGDDFMRGDFEGGTGNDTIFTRDGVADQIKGDGGTDSAQVDDDDALESIEVLLP